MADSVDRVFVHALNTVKRIRSARPPPADRLKLYGLYKQSMEGDVNGVMDRPRGDAGDIRTDQEKWDAWHHQGGLSRTEAKRLYISTLIETMHRYASQTPDARELIAELEFVWDQIKSNPPSSSSSTSFNLPAHPPPIDNSLPPSPTASKLLPGTYPTTTVTSDERNATAPSSSRKSRSARDVLEPLRISTPTSHVDDAETDQNAEAPGLKSPETPGRDIFVDAPDSQPDFDRDDEIDTSPASQSDGSEPNDAPSRVPSRKNPQKKLQYLPSAPPPAPPPSTLPPAIPTTITPTPTPRRDLQTAAGALIAPLAAYITKSTTTSKPPTTTTTTAATPTATAASLAATQKWQRRVEASLVKMTAELAALREQLDMLHSSSGGASASLPNPFRRSRSFAGSVSSVAPRWSVSGMVGEVLRGFLGAVVRVLLVDVVFLVGLGAWMRWRGLSVEMVAEMVVRWLRGIREGRIGRGVRKVGEAVGRPRFGVSGWDGVTGLVSGVRFLGQR